MKRVFLVYKTDKHHSYSSRELIGIGTDEVYAIGICIAQAKREGFVFSDYTKEFLKEKKQTQNYEGSGEFSFEEILTNKLL